MKTTARAERNSFVAGDCTVCIGSGKDRFELPVLSWKMAGSPGKSRSLADLLSEHEVLKAVEVVRRARGWPIEYLADFNS